jgi:hypothetical protein
MRKASYVHVWKQIIVATARIHTLPLMTADERIRGWGKVPII